MRRALRLCGPFLLDPACRIDFRQHVPREDRHAIAKAQLLSLLRNAGLNDDGTGTVPPGEAQAAASAAQVSTAEVAGMLDVFVGSQDHKGMLALFRFARAHAQIDLGPTHYNCLFRYYAFTRERSLAVQVLRVAAHNGLVNTETLALMIASLHHSGVRQRLAQMLNVIALADRGGISLAEPWSPRGIAPPRPEFVQGTFGRDEEEYLSGSLEDVSWPPVAVNEAFYHAPMLSALLQAVSNGGEGPVSTMLVLCWLRAAGAEITTWDYVNTLVCLMRDTEAFPHVRTLFAKLDQWDGEKPTPPLPPQHQNGSTKTAVPLGGGADESGNRSGTIPKGHFTVPALRKRVELWAKHAGRSHRSDAPPPRSANGYGRPIAPLDEVGAAVAVMEAFAQWWEGARAAGSEKLPEDHPIYVGCVNSGAVTLEQLTGQLFDEAHRRRALVPHADPAQKLNHIAAIVHHTMSNKISGVLELKEIHRRRQAWEGRYEAEGSTYLQSLQVHAAKGPANTASASLAARQRAPNETFEMVTEAAPQSVDNWTLKEIANFFNDVPAVVRAAVAEAYGQLCAKSKATQHLNASDEKILWALSQPLIQSDLEAQQAVAYVRENSEHARTLFKAVKHMIRALIATASMYPPANPKLTATGIKERHRWGLYCEARDIALTLYGPTRNGREQMKRLFNTQGRLQPLRSADAIAKDTAAMAALFGKAAAAQSNTSRANGGDEHEHQTEPADAPNGAEWLARPRLSIPLFDVPDLTTVPAHMADPARPNPYPQIALRSVRAFDGQVADFFPQVKQLLSALGDPWWLGEPDTYLALLRCYLHRLDWEGAVAMSEQGFRNIVLTSAVDAGIQKIFDEIGDPTGATPFKVAAKIVDLRISAKMKGQGVAATDVD
jgi:hypothetical protein